MQRYCFGFFELQLDKRRLLKNGEGMSLDSGLGFDLSHPYVLHGTAPEISVSLSARERAIVLLMGHGLTNKMIARQLSIAPETVKSHAKRIFRKLTVQTRAQAIYRASTLGLL